MKHAQLSLTVPVNVTVIESLVRMIDATSVSVSLKMSPPMVQDLMTPVPGVAGPIREGPYMMSVGIRVIASPKDTPVGSSGPTIVTSSFVLSKSNATDVCRDAPIGVTLSVPPPVAKTPTAKSIVFTAA